MQRYQRRWLLLIVHGAVGPKRRQLPAKCCSSTPIRCRGSCRLRPPRTGDRGGEPEQPANPVVLDQPGVDQRIGLPHAAGQRGLPAAGAVPATGGNGHRRRRTRPRQQRRIVLVLDAAEPAPGHVLLPPRPVRRQPARQMLPFEPAWLIEALGVAESIRACRTRGRTSCPTTAFRSTPSATRPRGR